MAKKIVTLYIDDTSLRLMVSKGRRISKLAEMPLPLSSAKVSADIKETELATRIKHLLKTNKVKAKKVILGISGRNCLTRPITLPQLPRAMLAEAVTREAKRVLPVPPEQLYLSWQTTPTPEGKLQVFLVAIPRPTADNLLQILHQAGIKPYLMDIKPLALARIVREATAIIIDVQPTEFDIVIMANGIPQPVRTIPFPSETRSQKEKLATIREDLCRTIEFYNSNNPQAPLAPDTPLFVAGELAEKPNMAKSLSHDLGYPVSPLASPLKNPKNLDQTRYLVNVGLALKEVDKEARSSLANVNALPTPYRPKPISLSRILAVPSAAAVISLIVGGTLVIQMTSADIAARQNQLDNTTHILEQKLAKKKELKAEIAELEGKIAEAETALNNLSQALAILDQSGSIINGDLQATTGSLVGSINLTRISHAQSQLTINGWATNEEDILAYARALNKSGRFTEVTIANIRRINSDDTQGGEIEEEGDGGEGSGEEIEAVVTQNQALDFTLILKTGGKD